MQNYLDLLSHVLLTGTVRSDRTGVGTIGIFGPQLKFDLSDGFPLVTTKRVFTRGVVAELLWMLSGETNVRPLVEQGVGIWTDWPLKRYNAWRADHDGAQIEKSWFEERIRDDAAFAATWGDLGPVYGAQWRKWMAWPYPDDGTGVYEIDQISNVLDSLKRDPFGRRHIVSAWNPADIEEMSKSGLPPCHCFFQFNVRTLKHAERVKHCRDKNNGELTVDDLSMLQMDEAGVPKLALDCHIYIRSNDLFLGAPFNIASYALLTHMFAQQFGYAPGTLHYTMGDAHIYRNHVDQVKEQLKREPRPLPQLNLREARDLFDYRPDDIEFVGYDPAAPIRAPVAV